MVCAPVVTTPLAVAEASGIFNVCVVPLEAILKSVPLVPVAKVCTAPVNPFKDVIAEPIRSAFIPGFEQVKQSAVSAGALGCGISGSGPTLFALSTNHNSAQQVGEAMKLEFLKNHLKSEVYVSKINQVGARAI